MVLSLVATRGRRVRLELAALGLTAAVALACSRADLAAITSPPAGDGSADQEMPMTCPSTPLAPGDSMRTLQVDGVNRAYVLHVPSAYGGGKPVPLLLDFHAIAASGGQQRTASPYPAETDGEGVVMAFPTGLAGPLGSAWNVGPCCVANADDVAFARALVAAISAVACIDPKRIYAAGVSMGGGMAYTLACNAADLFAGVAPSAFDLVQENVASCQPARPIAVISFRGSADTLVPFNGGYSSFVPGMPVTFLGAQATFQKWADLDHCSGAASPPDGNGCSSYSNCDGSVEVVLCTKSGGGQAQGNASVAWPLLLRHPLP
jgi:polyhydroxybutyrate depolymerase